MEANITDFTITEDFPNNEIEFDKRGRGVDGKTIVAVAVER